MASAFTIPLTVLTVVGLNEADQIFTNHTVTMRPVIGGFIVGVFLYAMSDLDPRLGSLFAGLIVAGSVLQHGNTVLTHVVPNSQTVTPRKGK